MNNSKNKLNKKRVAIIGAGASGLSCAHYLIKHGIDVDIYEKSNQLGGLASATSLSKGKIDTFYHHLFESDKHILRFLKKFFKPQSQALSIFTSWTNVKVPTSTESGPRAEV